MTSCPIIQNYGICAPIGTYGIECICPSQYEGDQCQYGNTKNWLFLRNYFSFTINFKQNLVKGCNSNPCSNGFSCLSSGNGSYICECKKDSQILQYSLYKLFFLDKFFMRQIVNIIVI